MRACLTTRRTCWAWPLSEWRRSAPATGSAPTAPYPRRPPSSFSPGSPGEASAAGRAPADAPAAREQDTPRVCRKRRFARCVCVPPRPPAGLPRAGCGLASAQDFLARGERNVVEVKIGIQSVPRELVVETRSSFEEIQAALVAAVADSTVFTLADDKGGKVLVPADKIAYLELGGSEPRRIGFGNAL